MIHTQPPRLDFVGLEETLERRALIQAVTKRIQNCRAVILTLGLAEVWRDVKADVFVNCTPIPSLFKTQPGRYEFHLTNFAENRANLEAIYALLSQYGHPDFHIIVTVSPVPLMNTFSTMDIVVANTWAKSLLRAVAQEWADAHSNVDYFPSYEIVQNSDRAAAWERDLRHVKGAGAQHIMDVVPAELPGIESSPDFAVKPCLPLSLDFPQLSRLLLATADQPGCSPNQLCRKSAFIFPKWTASAASQCCWYGFIIIRKGPDPSCASCVRADGWA